MEICCEKCGNTIDFVSDDEFMILFKKKAQNYLCFDCGGWNHPCTDCKHYVEDGWYLKCKAHKDNIFHLICCEKELKISGKRF